MRRDFSENYLQFGHALSKILASPILDRKKLKNIGFEGRQIINLPGGARMFRASPTTYNIQIFENVYSCSISACSKVAITTATRKLTSPYSV